MVPRVNKNQEKSVNFKESGEVRENRQSQGIVRENLKVPKCKNETQMSDTDKQMFNLGSCGLRTIHGAYRDGT